MQSTKTLVCLMAALVGTHGEPTKDEKFQVVKFGPENCISTYPSDKGTCILKTDCAEKVLPGNYVFGFVCADAKGDATRHVFGKDSYEDKETFDTLIACAQCLALDNFDSGNDTEEAVLKDEVETLKSDFNALNGRVTNLEKAAQEGGEKEAAPAKDEKAAPAKEAPKEEEKKALVAHDRHHHGALRHGRRHHPAAHVQHKHDQQKKQMRHRKKEVKHEDQEEEDEAENDDDQDEDEDQKSEAPKKDEEVEEQAEDAKLDDDDI